MVSSGVSVMRECPMFVLANRVAILTWGYHAAEMWLVELTNYFLKHIRILTTCTFKLMFPAAMLKQPSWKRAQFRTTQKHQMTIEPTDFFFHKIAMFPFKRETFPVKFYKVQTVFPPLAVLAQSEGQRGQQWFTSDSSSLEHPHQNHYRNLLKPTWLLLIPLSYKMDNIYLYINIL